MTIEAPDYYQILYPHSGIFDIPSALRLMQLGNIVAEINNLSEVIKVYKMLGTDIFQVNIHLGTLVKTNAFDYEHINSSRRFIQVELEVIKGSSEVPPILCREEMKKIAGIDEAIGEGMQTFEISTPPVFFEDDLGSLININFIEGFQSLKSGRNLLMIGGRELELKENEAKRFREFAKLHGIFGKDQ